MTSEEAHTKIVRDILAAKTLYDVLGVTSTSCSNRSQLRKAYLTTSVKVHPDKNAHPEATAAFQRVAEAYATLNDDSARAQYDAELRGNHTSGGFASGFGGRQSQSQQQQQQQQQQGTQYAYDFERSHMPSFTEALFMFATATSMLNSAVGGGAGAAAGAAGATRASSTASAASDFMETIFWATQLAEGRQQQDQQQRSFDPNDPAQQEEPSSAAETAKNNPMSSGMALGSGLRAIAATQRMMGMKKSAAATEKAATTVQVAAMGAAALQAAQANPAVQRTLERGQNTLRDNPQIGQGLLSSLKMAGTVISALAAAQQEAQQQQQQQQQQNSDSNGGEGNRNPAR